MSTVTAANGGFTLAKFPETTVCLRVTDCHFVLGGVAPPATTPPGADSPRRASRASVLSLGCRRNCAEERHELPKAIEYGTQLSGAELDATSPIPGAFSYSPAAGSVIGGGVRTLSVTFTPRDRIDFRLTTATVSLTVDKATPSVSWAAPPPITYGTQLSGAELDPTASVPGSFSYDPPLGETVLDGFQHVQVSFTPDNATDCTGANATVSLDGALLVPTVSWGTPGAMAAGNALSSTELDARASVPGSFTYSPAAGTALESSTETLSATFAPSNTAEYASVAAETTVVVDPPSTPTITWPMPKPITEGAARSGAELDASASVPGTFSYSPGLGSVPAAGEDGLTVTFTPTDSAAYASATASVTLEVVAPAGLSESGVPSPTTTTSLAPSATTTTEPSGAAAPSSG